MDDTTSREKVLKSVRNALISKLDNPYQNVDFDSAVFEQFSDSPEIVFAQEFIKVDGKFVYCSDDAEFAETLQSIMTQNNWDSIHCLDQGLNDMLKQRGVKLTDDPESFDRMKAGITRCEYLIARLGSVMVSSAHTSGRRMNVFPEIHLVYARASQLVPDLKDALKGMKEKYRHDLPSMISLITGPSRTADIEKTLVMGAHGPRELYVFLVDDQV
ncbi:MAG: LUD domain-containing protein [Bacteroidales bacterium]|nr:LUD domain-containing protein [Bacteroidales bacterium]